MATDLVSLVMQFLTPNLIGRIASALGLDRRVAEMAVTAAVPALIGGLANAAATPDGARKLFDTVSRQPPGFPDTLTERLIGSGQRNLAENGFGLVSSLLGDSMGKTLAGAISKFAGIDLKSGSSLLGLLAPVVMGALAKEKNTSGLDANGLASLLNAQKGNIQAALPTGYSDPLSSSGLFDAVDGATSQAARAASSTARTASAPAARAASSMASSATSSARWLYWAIPAVIGLGLVWWLFAGSMTPQVTEQARTGAEQAARQASSAAQQATSAAQQAMSAAQQAAGQAAGVARQAADQTVTGGISSADQIKARADQAMAALKGISGSGPEIASQVTSTFDGLRASLNEIKDEATARTALPKLQEAQAQVVKIRGLAMQLPAEGRSTFATVIATALPTINELCDKVLAIPGAALILKQPIDGLRADLATLARTQA